MVKRWLIIVILQSLTFPSGALQGALKIEIVGLSKTQLFSATQNQTAAYAKLLAHPARIAIIEYLLRSAQCCNSQLTEELGLAQATVSQHLKELKQSGLIQGTVEGVSINYCLNPAKWQELRQVLYGLLDQEASPEVQCC